MISKKQKILDYERSASRRYSNKECALEINTSASYVGKILCSAGLGFRKAWTDEDDRWLAEMYRQGKSKEEICTKLDRTVEAMYIRVSQLRKLGVQIPYRHKIINH